MFSEVLNCLYKGGEIMIRKYSISEKQKLKLKGELNNRFFFTR